MHTAQSQVFELCHMILVHPASVGEYVGMAFKLVLGAPALGSVLFLACWLWLVCTSDPIQDTIVTICTSYLAYFMAETNGISGVLTVLTIGLWMSGYGYTAIRGEHAQHMLHAVWTVVCWVCDTIVFLLAGAIIVENWFMHRFVSWSDIGYGIALYIFLMAIRAFVVLLSSPIPRFTGYGMQKRVCSRERFFKYMLVLSWGGLRGAVGLVLALIIARDEHLPHLLHDPLYCQRVLLFTGIIVVMTTLINAASLEKLMSWLKLGDADTCERYIVRTSVCVSVCM